MKKIKAYTGYKPGRHLYNIFEVVNDLPKVGEESPFSFSEIVTSIKSVDLDCEQGNPEVWDYDYYRMESVPKSTELDEDDDPEDYKRVKYICIEKEDYEEDEEDEDEEEDY